MNICWLGEVTYYLILMLLITGILIILDPLKMRTPCNGYFFTVIITTSIEGGHTDSGC
ncbi:MAG: hypothetical protein WCB31_10015 [Nitrososphaeraceae archaeon]